MCFRKAGEKKEQKGKKINVNDVVFQLNIYRKSQKVETLTSESLKFFYKQILIHPYPYNSVLNYKN